MYAREAAIEALQAVEQLEAAEALITTVLQEAARVSEAGMRADPVPAVRQEAVATIVEITNLPA